MARFDNKVVLVSGGARGQVPRSPPAGSAGCEGGDRRRAGSIRASRWAVELGPAASFAGKM